ncbi:MAG: hypothetical protein JWN10_1877 [Solirubrobacterales bacterium]|nr:hypothetical protein [Solirubrobacterales bacterium]
MSSVLSGDPPPHQASAPAKPPTAPLPPGPAPAAAGGHERNNTLTVIAGVGVLLLAMGVGVLIGRSGSAKQAATPAPVISVASPTSTPSAGSTGGETSFAGDWPSGKNGYTVQLQTLPQPGTSVAAVEGAKSAASAKGAKSVGALKSEEFSSLTPGSYVIYSGVYHKKPEAEKALAGVKKSFPGAKVIKVSNAATGSPAEGSGSSSGTPPSSESHPAPPSVLNKLKGTKGKNYEETSKNLPDVVETG